MSSNPKPQTANGSGPKSDTAAKAAPTLMDHVQTLQFAWFAGHAVTVLSSLFYLLSYVRVFPSAYKFWYKVAFLGAIESFGVLIYQSTLKSGVNVTLLLKDDNVHYLVLAVLLFVYSPYVVLTLSPFALFSTFHVLSYSRTYLFPAFGIADSHQLSKSVEKFVTENHNFSINLASTLEVYTAAWLLVRLLTFRANSLIPFVAYAVFIKVRFEKSSFTRSSFKGAELLVESLVNKSGVPAASNAWVTVKSVFHKVGAFSLVSDHTKEKAI